MIRSKTNQASGALDALTVTGHLQPLSGSTSQIYYEAQKEYKSDRRYVPLVLYPDVFVTDPAGAMTGNPDIVRIEWYDDVPQKTAAGEDDHVTHRIVNPVNVPTDPDEYRNIDYLISDDSDGEWHADVPMWGLIVHKNVLPMTGQQLYAMVYFTDSRTGGLVRKLMSVELATEYYDDTTLTIEGDRGREWIMDPLAFPEPTGSGSITAEPWQRTIGTQLNLKGEDVPDEEACYLWLVRDAGNARGWREFTAAETDKLCLSGARTRTLALDVRYIDHSMSLRCYAARRESGEDWATPFADGNPFYEVNLVLQMSQKLEAHAVQTRGFNQGYDISQLCHYDISLKYGQRDVPQDKTGLFQVTWKAINLKTFAQQTLGTGMSIEFTPSQKDFSFPEGWGVYALVQTYRTKDIATGSVTFNSGSQVRTRTILTTMQNDPLTVWGEMQVLQGFTNQIFDESSDSYEYDRRYIPLALYGQFYVNDPTGAMTGTPAISGIEWYDDVPQKTAAGDDDYVTHRISNPTAIPVIQEQYRSIPYLISDGSDADWCEGAPRFALIVHKNVAPMAMQQIYAVIKFVDTRTNKTVRKLASIPLTTVNLPATSLVVEGDRGKEWIMDPLAFPEPFTAGNDIMDEPWERTLNAQLRLGGKDVADAEACYQWVVRDDSAPRGWRDFDETERKVLLMGDTNTKQLTLDMRFVAHTITVRCYGKTRESGAAWSSPWADGKPYYECALTVKVSEKLDVKAVQTKGFSLTAQMLDPCHYDIKLMYGQRTVPANKLGLFQIVWKGVDNRTFQTQTLGGGPTLDFVPRYVGFSFPKGFGVYAEVGVFRCMTLVTDETGKFVCLDAQHTDTLVVANTFD